MLPRLMIREDPEVSELVAARFRAEGVDVLLNHKAMRFVVENGEKALIAEHEGGKCASPSTPCWSPSGASPTSRATASKKSA
jgi:NADPH-dependent 2,4-dienoyl-CoA reductase/sulfur reductase-like enzyme